MTTDKAEYVLIVRVQRKSDDGVADMESIFGVHSPDKYYDILSRGSANSISIECDKGQRRIFSIDGQQNILKGPSNFVLTAKVILTGNDETNSAGSTSYKDGLKQLCKDIAQLSDIYVDAMVSRHSNVFAFEF